MPPSVNLETVKNKYFLNALAAYCKKEYSYENYAFLYSKESSQQLYEKYVKPGAAQEVNISSKQREPLNTLAAQKKWSAMAAPMKVARHEVAGMMMKDTLPRFWVTHEGKLAAFMLDARVDEPKAKLMAGLLAVYEKPRTPQDKQEAYAAMLKITNMALLHPAMRELGLTPPAPAQRAKGDPAKALKLMGVPAPLRSKMSELIVKYNASADKSEREKLLAQMDAVAKGIVKHEQIVAALKSSGLY